MKPRKASTDVNPFYVGMVRQIGHDIGWETLARLVEKLSAEPSTNTRVKRKAPTEDDVIVVSFED